MTTKQNLNGPGQIVYGNLHPIVPMSTKRREWSPYIDRYIDRTISFGVYANRMYAMSFGEDSSSHYWKLRNGVMLYDVPEKPLEIKGPDTVKFLERVFCRTVADLGLWRGRYVIACNRDGGILMDGVLFRLAENQFCYVLADGEFVPWLNALAVDMDVAITDPGSRVIQVQGPHSPGVMAAATGQPLPEEFRYFHAGKYDIGGQQLLVSRTGWTGEVGYEIYSNREIDHYALWDHLFSCGERFGMELGSAVSMGTRRVEAGILDNITDIDQGLTPFGAGLGAFVDFSNTGFVGHSALQGADRSCLLYGLVCETCTPLIDMKVLDREQVTGWITVGDWSPTLGTGIGFVRFHGPRKAGDSWLGQSVSLQAQDGTLHQATIVELPFFDHEKRLPRGLPLVP